MVTAKDGSDDVVEALDLGANDYVTKPIDFPIALARIRTQVTTRRADPLTGLPNRVLFMDRLERLIAHAAGAPRRRRSRCCSSTSIASSSSTTAWATSPATSC